MIEILPVPIAAFAGQRRGISEARRVVADGGADDAPKVRPGAVGAALVGIVAGGAFLEHLLAFGGVGGGQQIGDRLLGLAGAALALDDHALDWIAHLLGPLVTEQL